MCANPVADSTPRPLEAYLCAVNKLDPVRRVGRIRQFYGLVVESAGPEAFLGERCDIIGAPGQAPVPAEVVGIRDGRVLLMPYGELRGIGVGGEVVSTGRAADVPVGGALLGRIVDAFCAPLDLGPGLPREARYPLYGRPLNPLDRMPIDEVLATGVRVIDTLLPLGRGQRMGIFAGSGVGKSTLLGMIARHSKADVNVIALVGERGREVPEFVHDALGEGLQRAVVVVATSDQPALVRTHAALTATAIAEYFRDQGRHVLLTMDSLTRFAMAQREIGLAVGEPPTARGYTPSVFAALPKLLERAGALRGSGSITGLYTVLAEGDDLADPLVDAARSLLDGHIVLSRDLANERHFPAVDVLQSNSRLLSRLTTPDEQALVRGCAGVLATYHRYRDMVDLGAYKAGQNAELDRALALMPALQTWLRQAQDDNSPRAAGYDQLNALLRQERGDEAKAAQ